MMTFSENTIHYQDNVVSKKSSSKHRGVLYHIGIKKWVSRVTVNNKRYNVGTFNTEDEAAMAIEMFKRGIGSIKVGKGQYRAGVSKYTEQDNLNALQIAKEVGVRKAGKITKMGSTRISFLRRKYREI